MLWSSVSGSLAGLTAVTIFYPGDVLRRLMQLNGTSKEHNYDGLLDTVRKTYSRYGLQGFYRGFYVTLMKTLPTTAILFALNEQFRTILEI